MDGLGLALGLFIAMISAVAVYRYFFDRPRWDRSLADAKIVWAENRAKSRARTVAFKERQRNKALEKLARSNPSNSAQFSRTSTSSRKRRSTRGDGLSGSVISGLAAVSLFDEFEHLADDEDGEMGHSADEPATSADSAETGDDWD